MNDGAQTWHHGLVAKWWAEFNDDFSPHEVAYFKRAVEQRGEPALDVGCGTGRVLIPCLRAGLHVDGSDVSADMIALCREKAVREGLSPKLSVQPMHQLQLPRRYRTILVCGAFGLGSTREQDLDSLCRFHEHLLPGGTLLLDIEVPYADANWRFWRKDQRASMHGIKPSEARKRGSDGSEYVLRSRILELDPLLQRVTVSMHAELWRDGTMQAEEDHLLNMGLYFRNELLLMLERSGFSEVEVQGDHNGAVATSDDDFIVFVARI